MKKKTDRIFFLSTIALILSGLFILVSASLGLITRDGVSFYNIISRQVFLGLFLGFILLNITSRIPYKFWKKFALPIFILSVIATILVFVPQIGFSYGGAQRWIHIGPIFFQPSEILKFGFVLFFSAWFATRKSEAGTFLKGFLVFLFFLAIPASLLYLEPDLGTLGVVAGTGIFLYLLSGGRKKYLALFFILGLVFLSVVYFLKPHARQRINVFLHPSGDTQGIGYQLQQSKIAIGSGGLTGRGLGFSLQKFEYLPQPVGDSIFAVFAEEFGFLGAIILISLFTLFAYRGLKISSHAPDQFGRLLGAGVVILIVVQAYANIAAMVGLVPLTGLPLTFVSHGGTALAIALAEVGIVLNISKYTKL